MIVSPSRGHALTSTGAEPVAMTISRAAMRAVAVRAFDANFSRRLKRRLAAHELHAVRFEERLDAVDVGVHDVGFELCNGFALDFGFRNFQSDVAGALDVADHFADVQQRFGGNAAPVEADAADLVAVDADDFLSELREPDRGVVSARARRR